MKKIMALVCFIALLSCESDKVEIVTVPGKYSIELPGFLSKATGLHDDASLQYQNLLKEFYIIVLDEPKQNFTDVVKNLDVAPGLEGYHSILKDAMEDMIENAKFKDIKDLQINGLKAKTFSVTGKIEDINAYYKIAYVEGKDRYYQIVTWTIEGKEEKFAPQMEKIITSFKELGTERGTDRSKK